MISVTLPFPSSLASSVVLLSHPVPSPVKKSQMGKVNIKEAGSNEVRTPVVIQPPKQWKHGGGEAPGPREDALTPLHTLEVWCHTVSTN